MSKVLVVFLIIIISLFSIIYFKINNTKVEQTLPETNKEKPKPFIYYNKATNKEQSSINILLLGLDARVGDSRPRCDAIHMISFIEEDNNIIITSVPRGISINLPGVASESAYIGNACHLKGVEYTVGEIEKITELHPDYLVKVGFSQASGIFRLLKLPTTSTLQFLRNRRTNLGDFQRSHNQAVFIKDIFIKYFENFMSFPNALKYLSFTLLDTNIEYNEALDLLEKIQKSGLYKDSNNIILNIKPIPNYSLAEVHFDPSVNNLQDQEYQDYQNNIKSLIENIIHNANYQTVSTSFNQKLWEQVEDEKYRNELHFQLLKLFVLSSPIKEDNIRLVKDFIEQMEIFQDLETLQKAQELFDQINQY